MSMPDDEPTMWGLSPAARRAQMAAIAVGGNWLSEQCGCGAHSACHDGHVGCSCVCHERTW